MSARATKASRAVPARVRALAIAGPTASGKTSLALEVAERTGAEILSCDSRQIYRGMRVGTAAPTDAELARAPHHLVGVAGPRERWSAGRFARAAWRTMTDIASRGRPVLVVGGSGLYLRAIRDGLHDLPADEAVRARLRDLLHELGPEAMHRRLAGVDAAAAASVHPHNTVRVLRALEVFEVTGQPMSVLRAAAPRSGVLMPLVGIERARAELYTRIDARAQAMFEVGWLDEVRALVDRGFDPSWPAFATLGYPEAVRCLRGELAQAEAVAAITQATRRFAKRQLTWFRGERDLVWQPLAGGRAGEVVAALARAMEDAPPLPVPESALDRGEAPE